MSKAIVRTISRTFKLKSIEHMDAGENVSVLSPTLPLGAGLFLADGIGNQIEHNRLSSIAVTHPRGSLQICHRDCRNFVVIVLVVFASTYWKRTTVCLI
jgi:hypothetical protein